EPSSAPPSSSVAGVPLHLLPEDAPSGEVTPASTGRPGKLGGLDLVAAISADDVWAVGGAGTTDLYALHWDGRRWTRTQAPRTPKLDSGWIDDLDGSSARDVWAVGGTGFDFGRALIEHWDGTRWTIVHGPTIGYPTSGLNDVAVLSPSDAWAVGWAGPEALTEHWDGRRWRIVPGAPGPRRAALRAVTPISPDDVWAVGRSRSEPLVEHWDGTGWSVVPFPRIADLSFLDLSSVAGVSASEVWAAGMAATDPTLTRPSVNLAIVGRWDGERWTILARRKGPFSLGATIEATSPSDLWLLTGGILATGSIAHWDGTAWRDVRFPRTGPKESLLGVEGIRDVAFVDGREAWAVGSQELSGDDAPLIERWDGSTWVPVPLGEPSPTASVVRRAA
ncbi:MAG: hypothetical protein ACE14W_12625, partial [Candidatus Velamenicoccus archaeovorus]